MAYTTNPNIGKVRARAVQLVRQDGWSMRQVARHLGVNHSTVVRWNQAAATAAGTVYDLPTKSSRPTTSPTAIDQSIVDQIIELRRHTNRCAEVIHAHLQRAGVAVSLSTVKRYLDKYGLRKKKSQWKIYHQSGDRPRPEQPGKLVEMDSIHIMKQPLGTGRMYIVTLIDVHSRWAFARASNKINTHVALHTFHRARQQAPFVFDCVQSDHGPEFSKHFTTMVEAVGVRHRHSRVRQPNDNAHIERFNRTIQEELQTDIRRYKHNIPWLNRAINEYIHYYNTERLHLGINLNTPTEVLQMVQRS